MFFFFVHVMPSTIVKFVCCFSKVKTLGEVRVFFYTVPRSSLLVKSRMQSESLYMFFVKILIGCD